MVNDIWRMECVAGRTQTMGDKKEDCRGHLVSAV